MRFLSILLASTLAVGPTFAQVKSKENPKPGPFAKEKKALEKLGLENRIEAAKDEAEDRSKKRTIERHKLDAALERIAVEKNLKGLAEEKERLALEYGVALERLKVELQAMELEQKRLDAKAQLDNAKFQAELSELRRQRDTLTLKNQVKAEQDKSVLESLRDQKERALLELEVRLIKLRDEKEALKAENDRKTEELRQANLANQAEREAIDLELKRMSLEGTRLKLDADRKQNDLALIRADLDLRSKKHEWKAEANKEPVVETIPFEKGRLTISDRRIALNGPIYSGVADYVTERIHYYNNISDDPVFLVIDRCPGGSVMEGYRIVKAIETNKAPVHVVVKSFAASMAAVITTLADRSYAYPNAVILHHEMSTITWGNMTQLKEQLEIAKEWEKRLHYPVAKKIGLSPEGFRKKMYENNSDGDWQEFADNAQKMKWVANIVNEIRETGVVRNPDVKKDDKKSGFFGLTEKFDEEGHPYVKLPRLDPYDMYYIHNPDKYYR